MERYGVIDLGTNTFHLLIADFDKRGRLRECYRERRFIKLGEGGIESIAPAPFRRGLQAIADYQDRLDEYAVKHIKAIGTAALRTADNGPEFIRQVREVTGIPVQLISGDEEARLIHLGVQRAVPAAARSRQLIVDIGGGSVELIIADSQKVHWARSFPIGVVVLYRRFHHADPMSTTEIREAEAFLEQSLAPLQAALQTHPAPLLIGAAGTFEVLAGLLAAERPTPYSTRLDLTHFPDLYQEVLRATLAQRLQNDKIPAERADMIVVSLLLIHFLIRMADIREAIVSNYAMKEGVLYEMRERGGF